MTGVVRARSEFVNRQPASGLDEKLDAEDADDVERFEHRSRDLASFALHGIGYRRGCNGNIENAVLMPVFDDAPIRVHSIETAGGDDGDFAVKRDESFEEGRHVSNGGPRGGALLG